MSSPNGVKLARMLHALDVELVSLSVNEQDPVQPLDEYVKSCQGSFDAHSQIIDTFRRANVVAQGANGLDGRFRLARAAIAFSRRGTDVSLGKLHLGGCLEAELRLMRSLAWLRHWTGNNNEIDPGHAPAAILRDIEGAPFAFLKSSGNKTAYAWRDASVATQAGLRQVPGNSFFEPVYPTEKDPLKEYIGQGLVDVDSGVPPEDIGILRFSTGLLPSTVAHYGLRLAIGYPLDTYDYVLCGESAKLEENLASAARLDPAVVERQVRDLLVGDKARTVGTSNHSVCI